MSQEFTKNFSNETRQKDEAYRRLIYLNSNEKKVPEVVIKRLPRYYRYLDELDKEGKTRISSTALSKKMGVTASQIRQDFNYFGGFGQQGYGYNVQYLLTELKKLLGINKGYKTVIVGAGNLGHAIANYAGLKKRGFKLIGIFDNDPEKIGQKVGELTICDAADVMGFIEKNKVDIAILTLPRSETEKVADMLAGSRIKGLWNFSYTELKSRNSIIVENVHLTDSLMTLSFKMNQN